MRRALCRGRIAAALIGLGAALAVPGAASAQSQPYDDWNPELVGFPSNAPESARANCAGGSEGCIDRTIGEMWRRFHTVVPSCDHNNVFSLTYLRVTEDIREAVGEGFYPDLLWINKQDAMFARLYLLAYDNFRAGRLDLLPESWRVAFGSAERKEVQGIGNLLLSMNAHVQRDMPFILYHVGLANRDGTSKKPDHDRYNARLRALYKPMLIELAHRFDPSIDDYDLPGTELDDDTFFSLLIRWRETAWQYAVELDRAGSDAERRAVARDIEANANLWATLIHSGARYLPGQGPAVRDARCAEFGGQRVAYPRGTDVAEPGRRVWLTPGGSLVVPLSCPDGMGPCHGGLRIRAALGSSGRMKLRGRLPFRLEAGERGRLRGRLGPLARALRANPERRVRLTARSKLGPGDAVTRRQRVTLRRR